MNSSRCRNAAARWLVVAALAALVVAASCGGPYTPKRIPLPGDKIALADNLFARGKYADAAVEYKDFLGAFAGDDRCDYAQFRLAESYRMDKEYALAQTEYRILINDYGYSEYVDDAFYLEAVCSFLQAPRVERDQAKSYEALQRLDRFVELFPTSDRIPEARAMILKVQERLAEKEFMNAKLYFSRKSYTAALIYLDKTIELYPATTWAARSRYYRGFILERRGDAAGAAGEYEMLASAPAGIPEKALAQQRLAALRGREGGAKPDEAAPK